ncbi:HK97-gp10 family putative phage morphogenesis protein [Pasteurella multocida]|uniref:HK97-gp10 family putative phage morphogenesis protein n=1 Tax=Pasteurella multocida TaxID=747 RepID=UPI002020323F|nr:HK97-gp10 family putative phage morphogenesis protein [Pasteurella multocida]MCL7820926.1 hypothetical protein [Pasteurella multocida]HDR1105184.1 hypothetical protein [Pasteurella multocida]
MSVKIKGLEELNRNLKNLSKEVKKGARAAARKALSSGAKEIKQTLKPAVPVMASSTNFRQKGVLKNNIRHRVKLSKDGSITGEAEVFFSDKKKSIAYKDRQRVGITATGKRLTGPVKIYLNDPYFWHMVDRGTVNGVKAQHFMKKAEQVAKDRALRTVDRKFQEEMKKVIKK